MAHPGAQKRRLALGGIKVRQPAPFVFSERARSDRWLVDRPRGGGLHVDTDRHSLSEGIERQWPGVRQVEREARPRHRSCQRGLAVLIDAELD
jgi:hypothetical protein